MSMRVDWVLWNKFVRRECMHGIEFVSFMTRGEDFFYLLKLLWYKDPKVSYLPKAFYHYVKNPSSISSDITVESSLMNKAIVSWLEGEANIPRRWIDVVKLTRLQDLFRARGFSQLPTSYPEIHARYIRENSRFRLFAPMAPCLALALRGWPRLAYCLYRLCLALVIVKESVQRALGLRK